MNNFDKVYESRRDKLSSCISHTGPSYKSDNGTVYLTLVQHTKNTEGDSMVSSEKRARNGRRAWTNLLAHFEGTTYKERLSQEASTILKITIYSGPKRKFSFGDYYKRHALAHTKFDCTDKPMTTE